MTAKAIPEHYEGLIPSFIVRDAAKAIEFYKAVFDATELMRMTLPGSARVAHAEVKIRDSVLMLGDECPEMGALAPRPDSGSPPSSVMIYMADVDSVYKKALSLGAKGTMPPMDMFWGDRYAKFVDPFGHSWGVATHTRDVSAEECARGMEEWGKKKS